MPIAHYLCLTLGQAWNLIENLSAFLKYRHMARSGVYSFDLIDDDKVCLTNLNRQIIATRKTVGQYKAEVMRDRILEINP